MGKAAESEMKGFSVVELILVLVVVVILAAIAIPITQSQLRVHRLDSTASIVGQKLMEARMDAIKRNRTSRLRLSTAGTAQVITTDAGGNTINVGQPDSFPPNIVLVSASDVEISFNSMGRTATAQTVTISDIETAYRKTISVSLAGKVTVGAMFLP